MNKIYLIVVFLVFCNSLFSQIALNSNNFPFAGMNYTRVYAGTDTIGPVGADKYFDFSSAFIVLSDTLEYIDATTTPFYSDHTSSEMAIYFNDGNGQQRYYYYAKDTNAFWENGLTIITDFGSGLDTVHSTYSSEYVDTLVSNQYVYGHTETEHTIATVWVNAYVNADLHKVKHIEVDAWGSMDTPFNHFDDIIRIKYEDYRYDSIFIVGVLNSVNTDTLYYYHYYAKDIPYPVMIAHTDSVGNMQYVEIIKVVPLIFGCTDTLAINYNPSANSNDSSCIYCTAINYTATPDTSICLGESIVLSVSGGIDWNWSTGDNTSSITVSPDSSEQYSVYISNQPLCWEFENIYVRVDRPVIADFWINNSTFSIDDSIQFINLSEEALFYYWDFDDIIDGTSYNENPRHKYTDTGNKNIMLISSNICYIDTIYKTITITNINEIKTLISNLSVYPNPGNNNSTIEYSLNESKSSEIKIFDMYGKLYASRNLYESQNNLKIYEIANDLPPGVYIISLKAGDKLSNVRWIKL
ncbi:MAG: T9SS type A sorting domain-containing protein [Bacteroidota bacterium]